MAHTQIDQLRVTFNLMKFRQIADEAIERWHLNSGFPTPYNGYAGGIVADLWSFVQTRLIAAGDPVSSSAGAWQPIETAPKDGTVILGWHEMYGELTLIHWGAGWHVSGIGEAFPTHAPQLWTLPPYPNRSAPLALVEEPAPANVWTQEELDGAKARARERWQRLGESDPASDASAPREELDEAYAMIQRILNVEPRASGEYDHLTICSGNRFEPPGSSGCVCPCGKARKKLKAQPLGIPPARIQALIQEWRAMPQTPAGLWAVNQAFAVCADQLDAALIDPPVTP